MSSPESREARQKRMQRQAKGSRDALRLRDKAYHHRDPAPGPSREELEHDPWSDAFLGEEPHDEEYFTDRELDFEE